jgi:Domain of unknown function (DUF4926)
MELVGRDGPRALGAAPRRDFAQFSYVALAHPIEHKGSTLPAGTRGVVVHKHADGIGYEVEFEHPAFAVITLAWNDLKTCE